MTWEIITPEGERPVALQQFGGVLCRFRAVVGVVDGFQDDLPAGHAPLAVDVIEPRQRAVAHLGAELARRAGQRGRLAHDDGLVGHAGRGQRRYRCRQAGEQGQQHCERTQSMLVHNYHPVDVRSQRKWVCLESCKAIMCALVALRKIFLLIGDGWRFGIVRVRSAKQFQVE
jgi:hypothetical protein